MDAVCSFETLVFTSPHGVTTQKNNTENTVDYKLPIQAQLRKANRQIQLACSKIKSNKIKQNKVRAVGARHLLPHGTQM
jgi:hypothetical protein